MQHKLSPLLLGRCCRHSPRLRRPSPRRLLHASQPLVEEETCPSYDPRHFFPARIGQTLAGRYRLVSKLGWGTGSTVWLARPVSRWPWQRPGYVALKITNSAPATQAAARRELAVSDRMFSRPAPAHPGQRYVRRVLDSFPVAGPAGSSHLCLAFEPLRQPLWMLGPQFSPRGHVPPPIVKALVPSILECLDYLHAECHIVHTDLKGDHFMVPFEDPSVLDEYVAAQEATPPACTVRNGRPVYESRPDFGRLRKGVGFVKVTDFGLAVETDGAQLHYHDIQPRAYTAPEVLLRAGWSYPADVWNLGLVMWELLGDANILDGRSLAHPEFSDKVRLAQMIRLLGPPPTELLARADRDAYARFFDGKGQFKYPDLIPGPGFNFSTLTSMLDGEEKDLFIAFARRMLAWLPEERATAKQLLKDPWLKFQAGPKRRWISKFRFGQEVDNDSIFWM